MKKFISVIVFVICMITKTYAQVDPEIRIGVDDSNHADGEITVCMQDSIAFYDHTPSEDDQCVVLSRYWHFKGSVGEKVLNYEGKIPVVYASWAETGDYKVVYRLMVKSKLTGNIIDLYHEILVHIATSSVQLQRKKLTLTHYKFLHSDGNYYWTDSAIAIARDVEPSVFQWRTIEGKLISQDTALGSLLMYYPGVFTVKSTASHGAKWDYTTEWWKGCSSIDTFEVLPDPNYNGINEISSKTVTVYPNPAENVLNLPKFLPYIIYDVSGRKVSFGESSTIDISALKPGLYSICTEEGFAKFLKN